MGAEHRHGRANRRSQARQSTRGPAPDPTGLLRLQRLAGNRAVGELLHGRRVPVAQRMVVVCTSTIRPLDRLVDEDTVIPNSIAWGLQRAGGPLVEMKDANFSGLQDDETVFVTGHGSAGSITGWLPDQILARLLDNDTGLPRTDATGRARRATNWQGTIFFLSCYAGANRKAVGTSGGGEEPDSSVVTGVGRALGERFPKVAVVGGTGPTIKAPVLGDRYYVVKEGKSTQGIATALDRVPELSRDTLRERYAAWLERVPPPPGRKGPGFPRTTPPTFQEKVAFLVDLYAPRLQRGVELELEQGLVYDATKPEERAAAMRVYMGGELVDEETSAKVIQQSLERRAS